MADATSKTHPTVFTAEAPAKINLFLAVTGRRDDGFHDLLSLVWPLALSDQLRLTVTEREESAGCPDSCSLSYAEGVDPVHFGQIPSDSDNLALRAVAAFRGCFGLEQAVHLDLYKAIPAGAGLGGGSSDAAAVLRLLATRAALPPEAEEHLHALAAGLGSDVPLFLGARPAIMRGRGEHLQSHAPFAVHPWSQCPVLLIKPHFGIDTASAYAGLASGRLYRPAGEAESALASFLSAKDPAQLPPPYACAWNSFESFVFRKYPVYQLLQNSLREDWDLSLHLTGSGSCAFTFPQPHTDRPALLQTLREILGDNAWFSFTKLR